jgi:hypothetical protein
MGVASFARAMSVFQSQAVEIAGIKVDKLLRLWCVARGLRTDFSIMFRDS